MTDLEKIARRIARNREQWDQIAVDAEAAVITAHAGGMSEVEIARTLGVNRTTVRKWLGK